MLRVDPVLFSNVATAVQRTGNLTGGGVRGLPGGVVIEGLQGVGSFAADLTDAQMEFKLGRIHSAAQRVRQLEMQFNGIVGRWNATANGVITAARQGKQNLPLQKLNEVKNAQSKMGQLTRPANKAFRDLISALEHAIASADDATTEEPLPDSDSPTEPQRDDSVAAKETPQPAPPPVPQHPDLQLLGRFAEKYRYGEQLKIQRGDDGKSRISPKFEIGKFYLLEGLVPPTVVRVRELKHQEMLVFDPQQSRELLLSAIELKMLLRKGIWLLKPS